MSFGWKDMAFPSRYLTWRHMSWGLGDYCALYNALEDFCCVIWFLTDILVLLPGWNVKKWYRVRPTRLHRQGHHLCRLKRRPTVVTVGHRTRWVRRTPQSAPPLPNPRFMDVVELSSAALSDPAEITPFPTFTLRVDRYTLLCSINNCQFFDNCIYYCRIYYQYIFILSYLLISVVCHWLL